MTKASFCKVFPSILDVDRSGLLPSSFLVYLSFWKRGFPPPLKREGFSFLLFLLAQNPVLLITSLHYNPLLVSCGHKQNPSSKFPHFLSCLQNCPTHHPSSFFSFVPCSFPHREKSHSGSNEKDLNGLINWGLIVPTHKQLCNPPVPALKNLVIYSHLYPN